jgi:hypothetical protein
VKGRDRLEDLGVDERIVLTWILRKLGVMLWIWFLWLRIGLRGWLLWERQWTCVLNKLWRISWLAERLLACQKADCAPLGMMRLRLVAAALYSCRVSGEWEWLRQCAPTANVCSICTMTWKHQKQFSGMTWDVTSVFPKLQNDRVASTVPYQ